MDTGTTDNIADQKVSSYEGSTQCKNWRYSVEQLAQTRTSLNEAVVVAIRSTFENYEPGSSPNVAFLNSDEEICLIKLYITKITQLCGLFQFPEEVEATAVTYLKRFYLKNTVMDWHPKNVMLTTLFLATKTTNNPISLEVYTTHIPKTTSQDVLDLEFLVAQSLNFEFAIWHAHRSLWGIWLDIQRMQDSDAVLNISLYDNALKFVRDSRLTDAELIYPPSQIALAAFSLANPDLASQWMAAKVKDDNKINDLRKVLHDVRSMITTQGQPPGVEDVREVDRRLRLCKNPEKVVGSKAYLAKTMDDERKAADKRSKKAIESSAGVDGEDPFGTELGSKGLVNYEDDDED